MRANVCSVCRLWEICITLSALTANSPVWMVAVIQTLKTKLRAVQHIMQHRLSLTDSVAVCTDRLIRNTAEVSGSFCLSCSRSWLQVSLFYAKTALDDLFFLGKLNFTTKSFNFQVVDSFIKTCITCGNDEAIQREFHDKKQVSDQPNMVHEDRWWAVKQGWDKRSIPWYIASLLLFYSTFFVFSLNCSMERRTVANRKRQQKCCHSYKKIPIIGALLGSPGGACAPCAGAVALLQWPGFGSNLWPFAACHPPSLSPISCPSYTDYNKGRKCQKRKKSQ